MSSYLSHQLIKSSEIPADAHRTLLLDRDLGTALISSGVPISPAAWMTAWNSYRPGARSDLAGVAPNAECIMHALADPLGTSSERLHLARAATLDAAAWALLLERPLDADAAGILRRQGRMTLQRSLELTRMDTFGSSDRLTDSFAVFVQAAESDRYSDDEVLGDLVTCVTYMRGAMTDPSRVGVAHRFTDHLSSICWRRPALIDRIINDPVMACGLGAVASEPGHQAQIVAHAAAMMPGSQSWIWLWAHDLYRMLERPELTRTTRRALLELVDDYCDPIDTDALKATRTGFTRASTPLAKCKSHEHAAIIAASWRHDDPTQQAGNIYLLGDLAAACDETNAQALLARLAAVAVPSRAQTMVAMTSRLVERFPNLNTPTTEWWNVAKNAAWAETKYPVTDPKVTAPRTAGRREQVKPATARQIAKIGKTKIGELGDSWAMAGRVMTTAFADNTEQWLIAVRIIDESLEQTVGGFIEAVKALSPAPT